MTSVSLIKIKCVNCNRTNKIKIYQSVNLTLNPEIITEVYKNNFHNFKCKCGFETIMTQQFLFHDMKKKNLTYLTMNCEEFRKYLEKNGVLPQKISIPKRCGCCIIDNYEPKIKNKRFYIKIFDFIIGIIGFILDIIFDYFEDFTKVTRKSPKGIEMPLSVGITILLFFILIIVGIIYFIINMNFKYAFYLILFFISLIFSLQFIV